MIIKVKWLPIPSKYIAITIYPFIFTKSDETIVINHEKIHLLQQKKGLIIGFYVIYLYEWITKGYSNISYEKEAYANERNLNETE